MSTFGNYSNNEVINCEISPPNRYGKCPCCNAQWDGGVIKDAIRAMDLVQFRDDLLSKIANEYGYSDENQKRFTNTIGIQIGGDHYFQCPSCRKIWEANSGVQYSSIMDIYTKKGQ